MKWAPSFGLVLALAQLASASPIHAKTARHLNDDGDISQLKAMLLKYVARCALEANQTLSANPDAGASPNSSFPGLVGLGPEWLTGKCDQDCQQRVSSCLLSLVNRTGRHVALSLSSAAPSLLGKLAPNADDRPFPHQEGAFFGNVWTGQAFSCQGTQVDKGPQAKRFCAREPETCGAGASAFVTVGACARACEMRCFPIGDGEQRCAAVSCRDPQGQVWRHPITTFLRNQIEAANADTVTLTERLETGLRPLSSKATATFEKLDFSSTTKRSLRVACEGATKGARLEVWLGQRKIGAATVAQSKPENQFIEIPLAPVPKGPNQIILKLLGGPNLGQLTSIELN